MKKNWLLIIALILLSVRMHSQGRNINKMTLQTTYSYSEIHESLRALIDKNPREQYFSDAFFNDMLLRILKDSQFTDKEKVQLFYLMQKKLGYAFVGVNYLPPKQNYFVFHLSKVQVLNTTREALRNKGLEGSIFLQIADSHQTSDPVIASNALLLATLTGAPELRAKMRQYTLASAIMKSKNPAIFNHYLCLSASLLPDSTITRHLSDNLKSFSQGAMIEDVFCALYSTNNPVGPIRDFIETAKDPAHNLAIQTALCALQHRVPEPTFKTSLQALIRQKQEPWKTDLLKKILAGEIPFNYSLSRQNEMAAKVWEYIQVSIYNDGTLISNNTLLEFDEN